MCDSNYVKQEMFKDDPIYNLKFVKLVEKYPCIYDYNFQDHSKRETTEKAWSVIGHEMKESVGQCKAKWKNLRTAFSRSMRKPPLGSGINKKMKDYYLKDAMQFVLPFMKPKIQTGNLPSIEEITVKVLEEESDNSDDNIMEFDSNSAMNSFERNYASSSSMEHSKKNHFYKSTENDTEKCFIDCYLNHKTAFMSQNNNPDLEFLKSLLPDISKMNDYQKRQFKKRTLDVIDTILCDAPAQSIHVQHVPDL